MWKNIEIRNKKPTTAIISVFHLYAPNLILLLFIQLVTKKTVYALQIKSKQTLGFYVALPGYYYEARRIKGLHQF